MKTTHEFWAVRVLDSDKPNSVRYVCEGHMLEHNAYSLEYGVMTNRLLTFYDESRVTRFIKHELLRDSRGIPTGVPNKTYTYVPERVTAIFLHGGTQHGDQ